ncbi:MAG: TonB-dependent receptor [candidate division KSB1 bacterium]|nr:TonB-dependent receptor [candidate division KSB1 bacterium]
MRKSVVVLIALLVAGVPGLVWAQSGKVVGKVTDMRTGAALPAANVVLQGTTIGAATNLAGEYVIPKAPLGTYQLRVSYIGYRTAFVPVEVRAGVSTRVDVQLEPEIISGATITVLADRAKIRETPVAFTDVRKEEMEARLGSQDIPLVLNTTPSVYATMQGGGAGDARVNVRGFNQRNVAIMINGVPVNDMENAWLYWSNWDGVADATSSIQIQRGLSAVNLATPSIGGTMNIITDPTATELGLKFKQEVGNDGFLKSTLIGNSGLIAGKYAFSAGVVRKVGDGVVDKTWTDAWAYYFGASWQINPNNRLELYALGAPQRHGQNSFRQNIGVYSEEFAKKLDDYEQAALTKYFQAPQGRKYNQNWGPVSSSYTGLQYWNGKTHERYNPNFINERENYYHKPLVNLNWYSQLTEKLGLLSTVYYSGGKGGGTGTYGSIKWNTTTPTRTPDWDATIAANKASATGSKGILRNSVNTQWTVGAIAKATYQLTTPVKLTAGVDWRTAEIKHYREVRDLLGGEYFYASHSDFWTDAQKQRKLGDKIDYDFTNTVDWAGVFGQAEYAQGPVTAYGMGGYSTIKYSYTNHFRKDPATGGELKANTDWISGYQVKGGASYRFTRQIDAFANAGYVEKVPIFDNVINDRTGTKATDPKNEKFTSVEAGVNYVGMDGRLVVRGNLYHTTWMDRSVPREVTNPDGTEGIIFIQGIDLRHRGVELEASFQPLQLFRLEGSASIGDWKYLNDVSGVYKDYATGGAQDVHYNFYVKDLKVGDAPQTQFALVGSLFPVRGLQAQAVYRYYMRHYADWDPLSRTNPNDRAQSWRVPNAGVLDFHLTYDLPFRFGGVGLQLFAHVFNVLDTEYIQDATDNSAYNAWNKNHTADDAEVFFGLPRTFNAGLIVTYR